MEFEKMIGEMNEPDENIEEFASAETMKVLIDNTTSFKGRITKPVVINLKYKDLAAKLSEATSLSITKAKAIAILKACRQLMGL